MFRSRMTLDAANRTLTIFVGLLLAGAVAANVFYPNRAFGLATTIIVAVTALSWAMSPCGLAVDASELRIERRMWPALRIARSEIDHAAPLHKLGGRTLRLFGVGGFFGSYGLFSNATLGRFRLYATRRGPAMIVVRRGSSLPIVATPDDVAGALARLSG